MLVLFLFFFYRLPLCEMHHAIDQLPDMGLVYPTINEKLQIPWTPGKQWAEDMSSKLNAKQREAIIAITCPLIEPLPPVLMIGPYGTGKTFTLAQAIKILLKQPNNRYSVFQNSHVAKFPKISQISKKLPEFPKNFRLQFFSKFPESQEISQIFVKIK